MFAYGEQIYIEHRCSFQEEIQEKVESAPKVDELLFTQGQLLMLETGQIT